MKKTQLGIWLVRAEAKKLGLQLQSALGGALFCGVKSRDESNRKKFAMEFSKYRQWILVMTTGIAVRYLQGLPDKKQIDPAVVVLDEAARFAISFLSGHEGGANALAYQVAALSGAMPVITTATEALKPLVLGVGCRKGVNIVKINAAIKNALKEAGYSLRDIREIATVDRKAAEPALLRWCERQQLPLRVISSEILKDRSWTPQPSRWVRQNLGVDGVCEPCALVANPRGRLLLPKMVLNGVTVAIVSDSHLLREEIKS